MRILISNDDGIYSPGLAALAEVASKFGEVRVVAPDVEQSSMGHAITHSRPLSYRTSPLLGRFDAYRVNGTPADCVTLGAFLWERVDVVLSGINLGPNIGHGIWHSGTLAAAKQAALLGLRGIALSTPVGKS
jgi:5'-nucleotidase